MFWSLQLNSMKILDTLATSIIQLVLRNSVRVSTHSCSNNCLCEIFWVTVFLDDNDEEVNKSDGETDFEFDQQVSWRATLCEIVCVSLGGGGTKEWPESGQMVESELFTNHLIVCVEIFPANLFSFYSWWDLCWLFCVCVFGRSSICSQGTSTTFRLGAGVHLWRMK